METTLQLILNELKTMNQRMDSIENHMGTIENRMDSMENRMGAMESRMDSMEQNLSDLTEQVKENNILLKTALNNYSRMENKIDSTLSILSLNDFE